MGEDHVAGMGEEYMDRMVPEELKTWVLDPGLNGEWGQPMGIGLISHLLGKLRQGIASSRPDGL